MTEEELGVLVVGCWVSRKGFLLCHACPHNVLIRMIRNPWPTLAVLIRVTWAHWKYGQFDWSNTHRRHFRQLIFLELYKDPGFTTLSCRKWVVEETSDLHTLTLQNLAGMQAWVQSWAQWKQNLGGGDFKELSCVTFNRG